MKLKELPVWKELACNFAPTNLLVKYKNKKIIAYYLGKKLGIFILDGPQRVYGYTFGKRERNYIDENGKLFCLSKWWIYGIETKKAYKMLENIKKKKYFPKKVKIKIQKQIFINEL